MARSRYRHETHPVGGAGRSVLILLSTDDARAYLDPGLGSMLLQGQVAGVAARPVALSRYWRRIKTLFSSDGSRPDAARRRGLCGQVNTCATEPGS
jgi:hypothetical protein